MQYHSLIDLEKRLSNAADEVMSCALAYDGEGPFRVLISDLIEDHQFSEAYTPLLIDMLAERGEAFEFEVCGDEIMVYRESKMQVNGVANEKNTITQGELDTIYQQHQMFFENEPGGQCADFSGMALLGLEMRGMDFSYANFDGAVLKECDMSQGRFEGCSFKDAVLESVQAVNTVFEQSDFSDARLEGGNFFYANFENSNFSDAVFDSANLDHANLDLCDFTRAEFAGTSLRTASKTLVKGLMFNRPDSEAQRQLEIAHAKHTLWCLGDPDGEMAVFTCMRMEKLDFAGKNFDDAVFQTAELSRCDLTECSLIGANFTDAIIEGCTFTGAQCQDAEFIAVELHGCDFTNAELDGADFSQATIDDCSGLEEITSGPALTMEGGI